MKRVVVLLTTAVLIVGLVGCHADPVHEPDPDPDPDPAIRYALSISATSGGSVTNPGEGTFEYDAGKVVFLHAVPDECYRFVNWTGDIVANPASAVTTVTMDADKSITANFALARYALRVYSRVGGVVISPSEEESEYDCATVVNLVAEAEEGYQFTHWTGSVDAVDDVNAASTTVTMMGDYTITANFAKEIRTWYDLDAIRDNLSGHYVLVNDLDSTTPGYQELASQTANQGNGWQPIGRLLGDPHMWDIVDTTWSFVGSLNGRGFQIRDLFVNRPDESSVGLFGLVGGEGVVRHIGVSAGQITGGVHVGSLVGNNWGTLHTSYSCGRVVGDEFAGGLAGSNYGIVSESYSSVSVTARANAGGLVGMNYDGIVIDSHSTGSVGGSGYCAGGLVGLNYYGTVSNSYSCGSVTGYEIGGLVGRNWGIVTNSHYNYDDVLLNGGSVITVGAMFSEDFDLWLANGKVLDINDKLSQEDGYYIIDSVSCLKHLLAFGQDASLRFRLRSDIDLASEPGFYIPYLAGEFDGGNHRISNLNVNLAYVPNLGLFGCLASGGRITRVAVENADIAGYHCVGGLVGVIHYGTVSNSYSTGRVTGSGNVGGLVGFLHWGTVSDSYSMSDLTCSWLMGGLIGQNNYGTVTNSHYNYNRVLINGENVITAGALFDEDFQEWLGNDRSLSVSERLAREDGYYLISSVADFQQLLAFGQDESLKFRLTTDLDLGARPNLYVPYFAGEFDGNGHRITNLSLSLGSVSAVGLFGYLASNGVVTGLSVESLEVTGGYGVGGLVGSNRWGSTIENSCVVGAVAGSSRVGGLVGWNDGAVRASCSSGSVIGESEVGGLVGSNAGPVRDCWSDSSATGKRYVGGLTALNWFGGLVSNCYSSGSVTGAVRVGGLVGTSSQGAVTSSFWDVQVSGQSDSDGGTGMTTSEMKNIGTFRTAGWSIVAVAPGATDRTRTWNIVDGQTYPFLGWQPVW